MEIIRGGGVITAGAYLWCVSAASVQLLEAILNESIMQLGWAHQQVFTEP